MRAWLLEESTDPSQPGGLASAIGHEIRQALTAIKCTGNALRRHLTTLEARHPEYACMADEIVETSRYVIEVVHRLETLVRDEPVMCGDVDLNKLVHDALRLSKNDLARQGVIVALDLDEKLPPVRGDAVQLVQVITNLVRNACDAMSQVPLRDRRLNVGTAMTAAGGVTLSISDSGPGIPASMAGNLFHPVKTEKPGGRGIGLTLCRLIAEAHRAGITARNRPDATGAVFIITFRGPAETDPFVVNDEAPANCLCGR